MKIILISPNIDKFIKPDHLASLQACGEVVLVQDMKPLSDVVELYQGDDSRIVAIDPDFCDWQFPNDVIDKIPNLKAICLQTTSFSWVDVDHCRQKNIPVVNLRGFCTVAVAEWVVFMALAIARRIPIVIKDGWKLDYAKHRGVELRGKTAGVIGLGCIGTAAAENLAGLGMNVQYWSHQSEDKRFSKVALDELMRTSDVIVVAVAYNKDTEGLITDEMLKSMKPTAMLIDVVHLGVYSHELLLELAANQKIGGYAFEDEKDVLGTHQGNVWNGPALGWCTNESMDENVHLWVEAIVHAAKGEYPTVVN